MASPKSTARLNEAIAEIGQGLVPRMIEFPTRNNLIATTERKKYTRLNFTLRGLRQAIILEMDAPGIPPAWLRQGARIRRDQLKKIAGKVASIRGIEASQPIEIKGKNILQTFLKIADLCT